MSAAEVRHAADVLARFAANLRAQGYSDSADTIDQGADLASWFAGEVLADDRP